jgi:hypothetical protein
MARFYFHTMEAGERIPDPEGTDLPDLSAAQHAGDLDVVTQRTQCTQGPATQMINEHDSFPL